MLKRSQMILVLAVLLSATMILTVAKLVDAFDMGDTSWWIVTLPVWFPPALTVYFYVVAICCNLIVSLVEVITEG